jgi:hypothetical protein
MKLLIFLVGVTDIFNLKVEPLIVDLGIGDLF